MNQFRLLLSLFLSITIILSLSAREGIISSSINKKNMNCTTVQSHEILDGSAQYRVAQNTVIFDMSGGTIGYNTITGCVPFEETFTALIDNNPTQPTTWSWNLGNAQMETGNQVTPNYTSSGEYQLVLETTILDYVVTNICVNVTDGYCGDVEEASCNCGTPVIGVCPDPYVDFSGTILNSGTDTDSQCWDNLSIVTNGESISFSVYDEDVASQDDFLGTFVVEITNGEGEYTFSSDSLSGTITIGTVVNNVLSESLTITVYDVPPMPTFSQSGNTLTATNPDAYDIQWYLDGVAISGATMTTYEATENGDYSVSYTDSNGCTSTSGSITVTVVSNHNITQNAVVGKIQPNPTSEQFSIQANILEQHDINITILNSIGQKVWEQNYAEQIGEQLYSIDASSLGSGIYFVQFRLDDGSFETQKLMIQ